MSHTYGDETKRFEALLRKRGVDGDADAEREIEERYRDTCAVLILDSSGFTRVTQERGIVHFLTLVIAMRDAVLPELERHGSIAAWAEADNIYAMFRQVDEAVRAALAAQQAVAKANATRDPDSRLEVGIGIGYGEVLRIGEEDVYGDQMNLASKLGEDISTGGEVLLTEAAWALTHDRLPDLTAERRRARIGGVDIPYLAIKTRS